MATIMNNIKEKLANSRELCPGMSKDFYLLTDYMSDVCNDTLVPMGIMVMLIGIRDDLAKGRNGFMTGSKFPDELAKRKEFVKDEIKWIPQLVDAISDEDFAEEFRKEWKEIFGFVPPKRVDTRAIETEETYPEYVKIAVDWWANAIISPKFDNGEPLPEFLSFFMGNTKEYSPEEIKTFKNALAEGIIDLMNKRGDICYISVDYSPCGVLAKAGELIGVDNLTGYPCKTYMQISKSKVSVSAGCGAPYETLWSESK